MYILDKRNTLWLRDTVRQTSLRKSAAGADLWSAQWPLTSLGMSARPYHVTTKYSYYISGFFLALGQFYDCCSDTEVTMKDMWKLVTWVHYKLLFLSKQRRTKYSIFIGNSVRWIGSSFTSWQQCIFCGWKLLLSTSLWNWDVLIGNLKCSRKITKKAHRPFNSLNDIIRYDEYFAENFPFCKS